MSSDDHHSLRLWLRLLACSTHIETEIRKRLRAQFGMTLARFDYLAQLHRHPDGLRMSALSRFLMVTGGNVTGLTDELEKDGLVQRDAEPGDRRSYRVALTAAGPQGLRADRQRARALGGRTVRRHRRGRAPAALRLARPPACAAVGTPRPPTGEPMRHEHRPRMLAGNRRPQAGYRAEHFLWSVDDGVGTHHAEPARAQEPADLRLLCRAARPVPAPAPCRRRARWC